VPEGETEVSEGVPSDLTAEAAPRGEEYYTVHPLVIPMYCVPPSRATVQELRRPPGFLQTVSGQLRKDLYLPFSFYRFLSQIQMLALKASYPDSHVGGYGSFQDPLYHVLAQMGPEDAIHFQRQIAKCIWEAYDVEWWFIIKERAYHRRRNTRWAGFAGVQLELNKFPTTEAGYIEWMQTQLATPLLARSIRFDNGTVEISDPGKSASHSHNAR
jgi:hypothetical protein